MNKEKIKTYANAIYQNVMVGVQSIRDIENKVEDKEFLEELEREAELFNEIGESIKDFASKNGITVEENNFFEKARLWISINTTTLFNRSTRHIAEMMLLGTVMGLTTCYKDKHDHKNVSSELDEIIDRLEKIEDENYLKIKEFLKRD